MDVRPAINEDERKALIALLRRIGIRSVVSELCELTTKAAESNSGAVGSNKSWVEVSRIMIETHELINDVIEKNSSKEEAAAATEVSTTV